MIIHNKFWAWRDGYDLDEQVNVLRISEPRGRYVESYQLDIQDRVTSITNIENQVMNIEVRGHEVRGQVCTLHVQLRERNDKEG